MHTRKMVIIDESFLKEPKKKQSKNLDDNIPVDLNIAIKYAIPCATSNALVELS